MDQHTVCNTDVAENVRPCDGYEAEETVLSEEPLQPAPKKSGKGWLLGVCAVVTALAVLVTGAFFWLRGTDLFGKVGKADDEETLQDVVFYVKDDELYLADPSKKEGIVPLSTDFLQYESEEGPTYESFGSYFGSAVYIGKDGLVVYYDKFNEEDGDAGTLYYRYVGKTTTEPIKIDSAVESYSINPEETVITYLTSDTDSLYQYDLESNSKEKLGGDVWTFDLSEDGDKVFFKDSDGNVYIKKNGEEKQKIVADAWDVWFSDDLTTLYYVKDDALYKQTEGEDRVKIDTDVSDIVCAYETGEIYYVRTGEERSLLDYVTDDLKEEDSKTFDLEKPVYDYEAARNAKTAEEKQRINEAYWAAVEEYDEAWELYSGRSERNELRQELKDCSVGFRYMLCYYDGTNTSVIAEEYRYGWDVSFDRPIMAFDVYDHSKIEKVLLSELAASYEYNKVSQLQIKIIEQLNSNMNDCLAVGGTVTTQEDGTEYWINDAASEVYYLEKDDSEDLVGELYRVTVTDGAASDPVFVDSDVSVDGCGFWSSEHFVYFKDVNRTKGRGDLYIDQEMIDFDVSTARITFVKETGAVFYYTDYDADAKCGTLKMCLDGETVKIADDVYDYTALSKGRVAYLYDYSTKHQTGELRLWQDGESRSLDVDVNCLVNYTHGRYRGV